MFVSGIIFDPFGIFKWYRLYVLSSLPIFIFSSLILKLYISILFSLSLAVQFTILYTSSSISTTVLSIELSNLARFSLIISTSSSTVIFFLNFISLYNSLSSSLKAFSPRYLVCLKFWLFPNMS